VEGPLTEQTGPTADASAEQTAPTEMVVTGSRLRDAVGQQSPVLALSQADLERQGIVSVGDILQRLPAAGGAINGKFNSSGNFGAPPDGGGVGAGATEIDLRYLGSKRVLVLVDGVRWVNGSSASGVAAAVDLNTIPLGMIERIEVLEDGASPVYGSDAISGVINIITRKKFQGASANAYVGVYAPGDGLTQKYDVTFGNTTERLSIVAGASYLRQGQISSGDRSISDSPIPTLDQCQAGCSGATPQGRIVFTDPNTNMDMDLTLRDRVGMPRYPDDYRAFTNADRFNFSPYNLLLTPSERISAFSNVLYKLGDAVNARAKAAFTRRESLNQAAPEPLFVGPGGTSGTRQDRIAIDRDNPYNPFGFTLDPASGYAVFRRPLESGPRRFEQVVNTIYLSAGLDGKFNVGEAPFAWDSTFAIGWNRADQRRKNSFNSSKLQQALGPGFMDADGALRCGTEAMPGDPDCVPFNIFGGQGPDGKGTITRKMLDYVTYTQHDVSEQRLIDWVTNVNGELVRLPGGPLAVGAGFEHRRLSGYFEPDAVVSAGDSADIPALPTEGKYHVTEAYAEARAPLVAKVPAVQLLDLNAAGRVSKYSFLDPEITGRLGGRYKPLEDLVLRASWGMGFRAPSIGELYGSASRYDATIVDPCNDLNGTPTQPAVMGARRDRCIALGVPADGTYTQANPQIPVATGGNALLQPERSKSFNISLAYAPSALQDSSFADHVDVEVAYYDIHLDRAITALDAQLKLDNCVGGDELQCSGITRNAQGAISSYSDKLRNIGSIKTRGIDLKLNYMSPRGGAGRLRARWLNNYLIDYWEVFPTTDGEFVSKLEGRVTGKPERVFPQFKSSLMLEWMFGDFSIALSTRYIHGVTEQCRGLQDFRDTCSDFAAKEKDDDSTNRLSPIVYNDVRFTWMPSFDDGLMIAAGVNNLLNINPPVCYSCSLNGFSGAIYDVPGVFGYVNASYQVK
jgi:iron complex outermembrane receptor protein